MKNISFEMDEFLNTLFLETPRSVTLGVRDAVNEISRKNNVSYVIFLNNLGVVEEINELADNPRPINLPDKIFDIKSRNRTRDLFLASVVGLDAKDALRFLGKLTRAWLVNATIDYLVSDRTDNDWKVNGRNADRITIIINHIMNINRSYELNY